MIERQCLRPRLPDLAALGRKVTAWVARRNAATSRIDWQVTIAKARAKLKRLYPATET